MGAYTNTISTPRERASASPSSKAARAVLQRPSRSRSTVPPRNPRSRCGRRAHPRPAGTPSRERGWGRGVAQAAQPASRVAQEGAPPPVRGGQSLGMRRLLRLGGRQSQPRVLEVLVVVEVVPLEEDPDDHVRAVGLGSLRTTRSSWSVPYPATPRLATGTPSRTASRAATVSRSSTSPFDVGVADQHHLGPLHFEGIPVAPAVVGEGDRRRGGAGKPEGLLDVACTRPDQLRPGMRRKLSSASCTYAAP